MTMAREYRKGGIGKNTAWVNRPRPRESSAWLVRREEGT